MDALGRVWDLRIGRCIQTLEGHVKAVLAADWSPNGYLVATGGEDNTARVYDMRKRGVLQILPGGWRGWGGWAWVGCTWVGYAWASLFR
jgi:U4/U6 small nuclear ribonucleoprotein PRP4